MLHGYGRRIQRWIWLAGANRRPVPLEMTKWQSSEVRKFESGLVSFSPGRVKVAWIRLPANTDHGLLTGCRSRPVCRRPRPRPGRSSSWDRTPAHGQRQVAETKPQTLPSPRGPLLDGHDAFGAVRGETWHRGRLVSLSRSQYSQVSRRVCRTRLAMLTVSGRVSPGVSAQAAGNRRSSRM